MTIATDQTQSLVARRSAIRAVGGLGATALPAVDVLLGMARDAPTELRAEAQRTLLAIGGPGTKGALEATLESAEDKQLALRDIAALGDRGREAGPSIERLLASSEPEVRIAAARALGMIGYRTSGPSLVSALEDPDDWRLVYVAAEALGRLRDTEAREALEATRLGHWYPPVRDAAKAALRALEKKDALASSADRMSAFDFFDYQRAVQDYPPCADAPHYPAVPARPETLDPAGQPALAAQLSYIREVRYLGEKGLEIARRRTIPDVGLRLEGGWLVGADQGEWGGELVFKPDSGTTETMVLAKNMSALHVLNDGRIVAVTGLAHLVVDEGSLYTIACSSTQGCTAKRWKALPGAPQSSWLLETGELLVNTSGGSVLVGPDGMMKMATCHAGQR